MQKIDKNEIVGLECKHVVYQKAIDGSNDDVLLVKEIVHTKDRGLIPRIFLKENYQRDFYITAPPFRNHHDKKEYEHKDKLIKYTCTQAEMPIRIQQALGRRIPNPNLSLRDVCQDPYVYFADITTPTLLKAEYKSRWPDAITPNKVAILDIETDVVNGSEDPILISVTMGEIKLLGIVDWFGRKIIDCDNTIRERYHKYLSDLEILNKKSKKMEPIDLVKSRGDNLEIFHAEKPGELIAKVLERVHQIMPDMLAIWNMNFDIPKINAVLEREGYDLADVWSDPCVPPKYRKAYYREAKAQRETNSKTISQHPADLWHIMHCLAGFYVIDAMCLFKKIRTANGNEPSYSLDHILKKHLGIGKLKFSQTDNETGFKWHYAMQKDYPAEYVIYNLFDCISIELLDERTNDLSTTVSALADISEYQIFPSLPKRLVDILTYFYLERGLVPGCVGADITSPLDEDVIAMTGWIVTLPAHMVDTTGLYCIDEVPNLQTMFRVQTADDDLTQAYPTGGLVMNISKETTHIELCSIEGVSEMARRRSGINLTGGATNAIEICNDIFLMPYVDDVLDEFMKDIEEGLV